MPPSLRDRRTVTLEHDGRSVVVPVDRLGHVRSAFELRDVEQVAESGTIRTFRGHAAVFGKRTRIGGDKWGFWEEVAPTAFTKTLSEADVRFLVNHDPNLLLARNKAGTLRLSTDETGLVVEADIDTRQSYTNDFVIALERRDLTQMSFAFTPVSYTISEAEDGDELVTLTEVRLWDVAGVTYPAYEDTDAELDSERAGALLTLTRSLGIAEADLLGHLDNPDDLRALVARSIAPSTDEAPRPAETTGDDSGPAETTRTDGEAVTPHPHRAHRTATLAAGTRLLQETMQ